MSAVPILDKVLGVYPNYTDFQIERFEDGSVHCNVTYDNKKFSITYEHGFEADVKKAFIEIHKFRLYRKNHELQREFKKKFDHLLEAFCGELSLDLNYAPHKLEGEKEDFKDHMKIWMDAELNSLADDVERTFYEMLALNFSKGF